jgi:hypothetical protein
MNCFVIMPFSRDFNDVYKVIQRTFKEAISPNEGRCNRLDETRPAGRITERLLTELQATSMCIADLTGNKPNVMWEVGYAMALGKPTIILTQNLRELPFDLMDMQSLEYDRNHLDETLGIELRRMIIDTISAGHDFVTPHAPSPNPSEQLVSGLREQVTELSGQVTELKSIVAQAVHFWSPNQPQTQPTKNESRQLSSLEGAWVNTETASHIYAAIVNDELVAPYCYEGNDRLVGVYFGWKQVGEHWFGRFAWLKRDISGFTFVKQDSINIMTGAWWYDEGGMAYPAAPPKKFGVEATWVRKPEAKYPKWASRFIEEVRRDGLESHLPTRVRHLVSARRSSSKR